MENSKQNPATIAIFLFFIILGVWAFYDNGTPVIAFLWAGFLSIAAWLVTAGKFKTTIIRTCVLGVLIDFIFLFTIHKMHPEEDIAGIVLISLMGSALLFAFIGYLIQMIFGGKKVNTV